MESLQALVLKTSYHKGQDDIADDFYLPCLSRAAEYDRAVGFFRSTVFTIAWPALREFVERGGKIRILCSQVLSSQDIEALEAGYSARVDQLLADRLLEEVKSLLSDEVLAKPARILAALIAQGTVDVKIAVMKPTDSVAASGRIFHDKLGVFRDRLGNVVVFKGSMNETWNGLAADGNLESVDVAASWMGSRDLARTDSEQKYFGNLWKDQYPTLSVRPFPLVARSELEKAADPNWTETVSRLLESETQEKSESSDPRGRTLRPHQAAGLASWAANSRSGILAFATGSGKTFTAITAIREAISEKLEVAVVVVPDQVLFGQWLEELSETLSDLDVQVLRAGAGHTTWRKHLGLWTEPGSKPRLVLATVRTAASEEFRRHLRGGKHLMLVADEVHRLGSPNNQNLLDDSLFGARLGLSATPERAGDPAGTQAIVDFFHGILSPRYSLADAVRDGVLTPYFYRPHTVALEDDEMEQWQSFSREIAIIRSKISSGTTAEGLEERLQSLYISRARVVKHARNKIPLAVRVVEENYKRGQRWIVYCEDLPQLETVSNTLLAKGIQNMPFHSKMEGSRPGALRWLESRGGILVAIKCLDEGVDIPSVTHALILASSKNPREFVQRRGRVLRRSKNKVLAYVHDAIVVPPKDDDVEVEHDPITTGELARALEFAEHADNPGAASDLQQIAIARGIDWKAMVGIGTEE